MKSFYSACAFFLLISSSYSYADETADFLNDLAGKYSGKGIAEIVGDKQDRVVCKIENVYHADKKELTLSGNCASVKGKGDVAGKVSHVDNQITGSLVSDNNVEVTKSSGELNKDQMILSTATINKSTGNLSRLRQIITRTDTGISAKFYRFDNSSGEYRSVGNLKLKRL